MIKAITIKFHSLEVFASSGFFCFPYNPSKKMPEMKQSMGHSCLTVSIVAIFPFLANNVSVVFLFLPANTKAVPTHCLRTRLLPKKMTEAKTVKNFLIIIINDL